jgi:hypothetical protein
MKPQINDICPNCIKNKIETPGRLVYMYEHFPYSDEHLWCKTCNSTYSINYKQMWMDDVNGIAADVCDFVEEKLEKINMKLRDDVSDEIFESIHIILEKYSTGDYKNHL